MALKLKTPEEREQGHQKFEEEFQDPEVMMQNVAHTSLIDSPTLMPYRGKMYEVAPLSVPDGLTVSELVNLWDANMGGSTADAYAAARAIFSQGTTMLHRLTKPVGAWEWYYRKFAKNPYKDMTEGEFVLYMRFLLLCRMR